MGEILTQIVQPELVGDQRNFCLNDDQTFGVRPCAIWRTKRAPASADLGDSTHESTIVPATKVSDFVPRRTSGASRFSETRDCILSTSEHVQTYAEQKLVGTSHSLSFGANSLSTFSAWSLA